jgi:hypothetical protein
VLELDTYGIPLELVLDNSDPAVEVLGEASTASGSDNLGDDHVVLATSGDGSPTVSTVRYRVDLQSARGLVEIQVWYPSGGTSYAVPVSIHQGEEAQEVLLDQTRNGGQWVSLGLFSFDGEFSIEIRGNSRDGKPVLADAVKVRFFPDALESIDYADWAVITILNPQRRGHQDNPDEDDFPNLYEYFYNLNPLVGDPPSSGPEFSFLDSEVQLVFRVNPLATDLPYRVEFSEDLQTWSCIWSSELSSAEPESCINVSEVGQIPDGTILMKASRPAISGNGFLRLQLQIAP